MTDQSSLSLVLLELSFITCFSISHLLQQVKAADQTSVDQTKTKKERFYHEIYARCAKKGGGSCCLTHDWIDVGAGPADQQPE